MRLIPLAIALLIASPAFAAEQDAVDAQLEAMWRGACAQNRDSDSATMGFKSECEEIAAMPLGSLRFECAPDPPTRCKPVH